MCVCVCIFNPLLDHLIFRYHELVRVSGEKDPEVVWGSAARFELKLFRESNNSVRCII